MRRGLLLLALTVSFGGAVKDVRTVGVKSERLGVASTNWTIRPAGQLARLGDEPQGCLLSPDGRLLAVANCGLGVESVGLYDATTLKLVGAAPVPRPGAIFHGLAFSRDGQTVYAAGGPSDVVRVVPVGTISQGLKPAEIRLKEQPTEPVIEDQAGNAGRVTLPDPTNDKTLLYPAGLALQPGTDRLWVSEMMGSAVAVVEPETKKVLRRIPVGAYPFDLAFDAAGHRAFVALWGAAAVAVIDTQAGRVTHKLPVGQHPCGLAGDPQAGRLYVANAHSDSVSVIDTAQPAVVGTISLAPYAAAPFGSMPNAVALSPDRGTLYVTEAGNNCVAVVTLDAARTGGQVAGHIPAGWDPTGVQVRGDGTLLVVSSKGLGTTQNAYPRRVYVGSLHHGLGQIIAAPTPAELATLDGEVRDNNYVANEARVRVPADAPTSSPIPRRVGDPSPIKYCVYVIKENRTYDQVYGDLPQGDGDAKLCLFGRRITPNQHRLVTDYVLLDNFYCDGSVSVDGHQWAKAANVSDAVDRSWPLSYSQRGPTLGGPVSSPAGGYLWTRAAEAGVTSKQYGSPINPGSDLKAVATVLGDVQRWEGDGQMPRLIVMHLPNNHTFGTLKGKPKPEAMVAENDLAVGRLIAGLSRSKFWPEMTVFVVEDDAQDGPDHVDCHRSPAMVIGPWVKRGIVDSNFYDQCAVCRTIGLILGLRPLSQFDAAAMPMITLFAAQPTVTTYEAVEPEQRLDELNALGAYGQTQCAAMDFGEVDAAPFPALNDILWHAIRGAEPYPTTRSQRYRLAVREAADD